MTPEQCKTLLESGVLQAYADGKEIQLAYRAAKGKEWATCDSGVLNLSDDRFVWRVKPEKKTGWINIYPPTHFHTVGMNSIYDTKENADTNKSRDRIACIQITYEEGEGL